MASLPVRDPVGDRLLTPQNVAMFVIDYQPSQFAGVRSMDRDLLLKNIVSTVKAFGVPIVHSTINVATGRGQPTVPERAELLEDDVYPVVDAIGGTSEEAHRAGLERVVQAGGKPNQLVALACELQRDWARQETVQKVVQIVLTERLLQE